MGTGVGAQEGMRGRSRTGGTGRHGGAGGRIGGRSWGSSRGQDWVRGNRGAGGRSGGTEELEIQFPTRNARFSIIYRIIILL